MNNIYNKFSANSIIMPTKTLIYKMQSILINNRLISVYRSYHNNNLYKRFIFVHINKTGGISVEKSLKLYGREHRTALMFRDYLGEEQFNRVFKFAFVRNPWDKVVSHYCYRYQTNQTQLKSRNIGFKEWIMLTYCRKDPNHLDFPRMFLPQLDWICDEKGNVIIDYIGRFENIQHDFNKICDRIDIKRKLLPHKNKTKRKRDYRLYYDEESNEIISKYFKKDIEYFNYTF